MNAATPRLGKILLVDDDPQLGRSLARILTLAGYQVTLEPNPQAALALVSPGLFDVFFCDINLPGMAGTELLARARRIDAQLPVVMMTGAPALSTAIQALEHGASRYLVKPFTREVLIETAQRALQLSHERRATRPAVELGQVSAQFARGLDKLWMAFQPIVDWPSGGVFGHEALVRTDEPELRNPALFLAAAEQLSRLPELGRAIRAKAARTAELVSRAVFVNLHPYDLLDPELFDASAPLSRIAGRVVLEVTERAALEDVHDLDDRIEHLRKLHFRIAIDDLGAGYSGLTSFARLAPEFVKLDMSLVRNLHENPLKQRIVHALLKLCRELGTAVIAEGVETVEERDALVDMGCELLQGYLFARPARELPTTVTLGPVRPFTDTRRETSG